MSTEILLDLVMRARDNDQAAFVALCQYKGKDILYTCYQLMGNREDAEDAAQEVFIRMQSNIRKLKAPEAFSVWVYRLVVSACNDMRRKTMKTKYDAPFEEYEEILPNLDLDILPQEYLDSVDRKKSLLTAIKNLPYQHRLSVILYYYEGMSYKEIGEIVGATPKAVDNYLQKARRNIKREIEGDTLLHSAAPMLALAPIMKTVLQESADLTITSGAVQACIAASGIGAAAGGTVITSVGLMVSKIVLSVLVGALVVSTGVTQLLTMHAGAAPPLAFPPSSAATLSADAPQHPASSVAEAGSENIDTSLATGSIGGWVYLDVPDAPTGNAQHGIGNVQLEVVAKANPTKVLQTVYTQTGGKAGYYEFKALPAGEYMVRVRLPNGAEFLKRGKDAATILDNGTGWVHTVGSNVFLLKGTVGTRQLLGNVAIYYPAQITGKLVFADKDGQPVPGGEKYIQGYTAKLVNAQNITLAKVPVSAEGKYVFENPIIPVSGSYSIQFEGSAVSQFDMAKPVGLAIEPGQSAQVDAAVTDTSAPAVHLYLEESYCVCGHINPQRIIISVFDQTDFVLKWELKNQAGEIVQRGEGDTAGAVVAKMIEDAAEGDYTLVVTATDAAGNATEAQALISIISV